MKGRIFTEQKRQILEDIIVHRRTEPVAKFINKEIPDLVIERLLFAALHAPSVGFSQPWEFVIIRDPSIKAKIKASFERENEKAEEIFKDRPLPHQFQLIGTGITTTPVNIAVFYKPSSAPVLGQTSMDKVGPYSVCLAIQNLWLMARAENIGLGWVSVLDEEEVKTILNAPPENELIAYLCIGYVTEFTERPQLEIANWEKCKSKAEVIYYNSY
ncbi:MULTISPECIES: 5,6-dimethylbenzimidazole synthase [Okeania]|uniref:5,6-dimethylbenzimidazole synthase n=1 Tax=Okeania hirsuta TaxID=1458930 RepID=A0A3N6QTE9_9CYAN|nr:MULTISPECIES: 5,6-dimethylbenzimidazole synthase [Okeania]NES92780.1 5,6-dimethylbenzimidazole synthase [Okeania sp. SIO2B9]NET75228.1 5,6-dimethylbenzimidazole synthase [Okeania sp. SIO1F9]RQH19453.1 5,6-dimethylbenzimidazole synthase [Okeania hirsuta]RQH35940.1 5,6-dimethylbenzimidazole synthase [Okeania hirsuta]